MNDRKETLNDTLKHEKIGSCFFIEGQHKTRIITMQTKEKEILQQFFETNIIQNIKLLKYVEQVVKKNT